MIFTSMYVFGLKKSSQPGFHPSQHGFHPSLLGFQKSSQISSFWIPFGSLIGVQMIVWKTVFFLKTKELVFCCQSSTKIQMTVGKSSLDFNCLLCIDFKSFFAWILASLFGFKKSSQLGFYPALLGFQKSSWISPFWIPFGSLS